MFLSPQNQFFVKKNFWIFLKDLDIHEREILIFYLSLCIIIEKGGFFWLLVYFLVWKKIKYYNKLFFFLLISYPLKKKGKKSKEIHSPSLNCKIQVFFENKRGCAKINFFCFSTVTWGKQQTTFFSSEKLFGKNSISPPPQKNKIKFFNTKKSIKEIKFIFFIFQNSLRSRQTKGEKLKKGFGRGFFFFFFFFNNFPVPQISFQKFNRFVFFK